MKLDKALGEISVANMSIDLFDWWFARVYIAKLIDRDGFTIGACGREKYVYRYPITLGNEQMEITAYQTHTDHVMVSIAISGSPPLVALASFLIFLHHWLGVDEEFVAQLATNFLNGAKPDPPGFSERQREVIGYLLAGMNQKEIAETLFLSSDTIKYHYREISQILGLDTIAQSKLREALRRFNME